MDGQDEVLCERAGEAGLITLNRPKALNALTLGMVRAMRAALDGWADDPLVTRIVVQGAGGKAFCAGGDIRRLYEMGRAGEHEEALTFWREEYELNVLIQRYPKPYVSLIDGICMGGGVGISLHGSHRVAGENYLFAMPEVGIGFFPDVGATYALPRLPGRTGAYLALTGARVKAADALALGLATHAVASADIDALREALVAGEDVDGALASRARDPGPAPLETARNVIDDCFSQENVGDVLDHLDAAAVGGSMIAGDIAAVIRTKSPTSLCIAFEQMRRGPDLDFTEAMKLEFRIVSRILDGHDFYEGVRSVIIDKDQSPDWRPDNLPAVTPALVEAYFADLGERELVI